MTNNIVGTSENARTKKKGARRPFSAQMFVVSTMIYFVAAGLVPKEDMLFTIFASVYIVLMNRHVYTAKTSSVIPGMWVGHRVFAIYINTAAVIGLLLPVVYIVGLLILGDRMALEATVPSLFLLLAQVLSEGLCFKTPSVSLLIRALVPIMYNTRRIFTIWSWTLYLFGRDLDQAFSSGYWLLFGRIVVVLNVIIWNYNLFCFLLPVFLPRSMRNYYKIEQELKQSQEGAEEKQE